MPLKPATYSLRQVTASEWPVEGSVDVYSVLPSTLPQPRQAWEEMGGGVSKSSIMFLRIPDLLLLF